MIKKPDKCNFVIANTINHLKILIMKTILLFFIVFIAMPAMCFSQTNMNTLIENDQTIFTQEEKINNSLNASVTLAFNSDVVYINWVTNENKEDNYYMIERSNDGVNFNVIGLKNGITSKTNINLMYSYIDKSPLSNYSYYRIKQISNRSNEKMTASYEIFTKQPKEEQQLYIPFAIN